MHTMLGIQSPKPKTRSLSITDHKPPSLSPRSVILDATPNSFDSIGFTHTQVPVTISRKVDLDGMTVMTGVDSVPDLSLSLDLERVDEEGNMFDAPDSPTTAAFAPLLNEIFGPGWRCPSPVVLHIGNAPSEASTPSTPTALCPIWKKSNEMFGKVFSYRPGTSALNAADLEAGLLYLGIKQGWESFNEWMQSPVLKILKEVDEFLFFHQPQTER